STGNTATSAATGAGTPPRPASGTATNSPIAPAGAGSFATSTTAAGTPAASIPRTSATSQPAASVGTSAPAEGPAGVLHSPVSAKDSEVPYTVNEKLSRLPAPSDAVGKTSTISGDVYLTTAGLAPAPGSKFVVDLRTLKSDEPVRDNFIQGATLQ